MAYEELLVKTGISPDQAKIYETLLKNGVMPASKAALKAGLKRGLGYKVIEQLVSLGLVEKIDKKVALFAATHPSKIKELIQRKNDELKSSEASLSGILGSMISDYNLTSGKPNVQFFEGKEGIWKVLNDSLTAKESIDAYSDIESIEKYIPEINREYASKREKMKIKKRGLILDTPKARELLSGYHTSVTENRFIHCSLTPSKTQTILQIYNNKISYITLDEEIAVGTIIEDPHIYTLHKYIFQCLWEIAKNSEA